MAVTYEKIELGTVVGPQGAQGVQGVQGPAGPQGPTGPQGPAGGTFTEAEVKEFAKEVAESYGYMKKVADSDLNMNGHTIRDCSRIVNKSLTGAYATNTYFVPTYGYADIGASSSDLSDYIKKWILRVIQDFNGSSGIYIGNVQPSNTGIMIFHLYTASLNADTGLPNFCSGLYYSYSTSHFVRFYTVNGIFNINKVSEFSYGSTTLDNGINSMGSNYIRYENGLQICWGEVVWEGTITTSWNGSGMYFGSVNADKNFPQPFSEKTRVIPNISGADQQVVLNRLEKDTTKITQITLASGTSYTDPIRAWIDYVAVGRWK